MVYVGLCKYDTIESCDEMIDSLLKLQLWDDKNGKMWKTNVMDNDLDILFGM